MRQSLGYRSVRLLNPSTVTVTVHNPEAILPRIRLCFLQKARLADTRLAGNHQQSRSFALDVAFDQIHLTASTGKGEKVDGAGERGMVAQDEGCVAPGLAGGVLESVTISGRQLQSSGQSAQRIFVRNAANAAFERANGEPAHPGMLRQFFLGQGRGKPVMFEDFSKQRYMHF
jgi:hypothetical protein